jgi:hypothetical protein
MIIEYGGPFKEKAKKEAEKILNDLPYRYCFITGSFLFKDNPQDIDVFVITRSKKQINLKNKKIKITRLDFNDLHSLFYHSISKECIAKNILPQKKALVTSTQYWDTINESVPIILNEQNSYLKEARDLVLYTEYFKSNRILSSSELNRMIGSFENYKTVLKYIQTNVKTVIIQKVSKGYIKRFFYTQAGHYKKMLEYPAQSFLYKLSHAVIGATNG